VTVEVEVVEWLDGCGQLAVAAGVQLESLLKAPIGVPSIPFQSVGTVAYL
jgi:hypothetical protein